MNQIQLIGNLAADPEVKSVGESRLASFRLAVRRKFKDKEGNYPTDWIPVQAWGKTAELCGKFLKKGDKACIVGSLQTRSYEDKDGNKRTSYEVNAIEVEFLTPKSNDSISSYKESEYEGELPDALPF